jgi:syntaxin 5
MQSHQHQQLLLAPIAETQYYDQREKAVSEVEKTIGELGTLFKRLATMISEQQEMVERIDEDVENSISNADRAHALPRLHVGCKEALHLGLLAALFGDRSLRRLALRARRFLGGALLRHVAADSSDE